MANQEIATLSISSEDAQSFIQSHKTSKRQLFEQRLFGFVNALRKKYSRDQDIQSACQKFDFITSAPDVKATVIEEAITSWYKCFHPLLNDVTNGKFTCISAAEHPLFDQLKMKQRFKEAKLSTKRVILAHVKAITEECEAFHMYNGENGVQRAIDTLNGQQADMQNGLETIQAGLGGGLMTKIMSMTQNLSTDSNGMPDINQILGLSQQIVAGLSQDDVNSLTELGSSGKLNAAMQNVLKVAGNGEKNQQLNDMMNLMQSFTKK